MIKLSTLGIGIIDVTTDEGVVLSDLLKLLVIR